MAESDSVGGNIQLAEKGARPLCCASHTSDRSGEAIETDAGGDDMDGDSIRFSDMSPSAQYDLKRRRGLKLRHS
jgi:hypothetical protein